MNTNLFPQDQPAENTGNNCESQLNTSGSYVPLADRMRPISLDEVVGQNKLLGERGPLRLLVTGDSLPSLLLWGPPGCGKTTLARLVAHHTNARFLEFSAVAVGSKELKAVMAEAAKLKSVTGKRTILFLDEIHRFNKAQQDALLPWVERGDVTLIGATTENPSFEVNSALISRTRLFVLEPLSEQDLLTLLKRSLEDVRGLAAENLAISNEALSQLALMSEGDARAALGLLESVAAAWSLEDGPDRAETISVDRLNEIIQSRAVRYDKAGEQHYNIISALHKSLRNSDVQASIYWLGRMLEGGEDPMYIARRLVRFASEDVGLAEPEALRQTLAAKEAVAFLGLPECKIALAQAVVHLALSPKSAAVYKAYNKVAKEIAKGDSPPVPLHIRNAPTKLMKGLGYGDGYEYAPDTKAGISQMNCLPDSLQDREFYQPGRWGFEQDLAQRMEKIQNWQKLRRTKTTDNK